MPHAISLTRANIDKISDRLGINKRDVMQEWFDRVLLGENLEPIYYVQNVLYMTTKLPYLIYERRLFLDDFASIPEGIQDRWVKVTQIKTGP